MREYSQISLIWISGPRIIKLSPRDSASLDSNPDTFENRYYFSPFKKNEKKKNVLLLAYSGLHLRSLKSAKNMEIR